jgi:hypothetical protein
MGPPTFFTNLREVAPEEMRLKSTPGREGIQAWIPLFFYEVVLVIERASAWSRELSSPGDALNWPPAHSTLIKEILFDFR